MKLQVILFSTNDTSKYFTYFRIEKISEKKPRNVAFNETYLQDTDCKQNLQKHKKRIRKQ